MRRKFPTPSCALAMVVFCVAFTLGVSFRFAAGRRFAVS